MAEYWSYLNRLRHELGKRYTVAVEHTRDPGQINVLIRRVRRDEMLTIVADTRWLAQLLHEGTPSARIEYRQLITTISSFFANPEALPSQLFYWPGTPESREELHHNLNLRRRGKAI